METTVKKKSWEIEREKREKQAARVLTDEIWPISEKLQNVCLLLQEVTEEYFCKYNWEKESDRGAILWEFPRNARFINIITDYACQAKNALAALEAMGTDKALKVAEGAHPVKE